MTEPSTRVARVCSLLNAADARYVVVGATAMQLWGTSRATRDIDVLIEPTLDNAARVLEALARLPFGVASELTPNDILRRGVTMIGDVPNVDVLIRAWNVQWPEASRSIAVFEVEGIPIPTASLETLIASKRTGRPQDTADILVLEAMLSARDQP
jgi:hypothetical protein